MASSHRFLICLLAAALAGPALALAPAESYEALRQLPLDGRRVAVRNLVLERDAFRFTLESGELHLAQPIDGREAGAVFLGRGRLELTPADARERHHLALLAGEPGLLKFSDTFEKMLLLFADATAEEILAHGELAEGPASDAAAQFNKKCLRREKTDYRTNFRLRMLQERLNHPAENTGLFLAFVELQNNPTSLVAVDPMGADNLWVGSNAAAGDGPEESALFFMDEHNKGFAYLSHRKGEIDSGKALNCRRKSLADARHYEIDTWIRPDESIKADTVITLRSEAPSLRVLPIRLMGELRIESAEWLDGAPGDPGTELAFIQEKPYEDVGSLSEWESADAAVIFPTALERGTEVRLRLAYSGKEVLEDAGDGNYYIGSRTHWYPNLGAFNDWATYGLTFRFPQSHDLVSVGTKISESVGEGDLKFAVWKADYPIAVAGFNYGKFRVVEERDDVSGVAIQVYTNPGTPDIVKLIDSIVNANSRSAGSQWAGDVTQGDAGYEGYVPGSYGASESFSVNTLALAQDALVDGLNSAKLYHTLFGPIPAKRVAITQQSNWGFGQSWPTLIYMPYLAFMNSTQRAKVFDKDPRGELAAFVNEVGFHEMAHQWWGHLLGNESYRDTWLSEGLAQFSTAVAVERINGPAESRGFWDLAQKHVIETSGGSGSVLNYQAGPITQGTRLATRKSPGAYRSVVYEKGAFVIHMLRMMMRDSKSPDPDARFFAMMRDFAQSYAGQNPSTADFQATVQKHMIPELNARRDGKIDWFFEQWVHGTEIPRYRVDVAIDKAGKNKYRVHGQVRQEGVSDEFMALVPLYFDFGKGKLGMFGRAAFKGNMGQKLDQTIELPKKPKAVVVNANHEVLALN